MSVVLTQNHWIAADLRVFNNKKKHIQGALQGDTGIIDGVSEENKEEIFYMLMFCLCVPQSKAVKAEEAIEGLRKEDFYNKALPVKEITDILAHRVRFHPTKAHRLFDARDVFFYTDFWDKLCAKYSLYQKSDNKEMVLKNARVFLIKEISGVGMKLASHFLRNIGMRGLAILDVHVIDGLKKRGVIDIDKLGPSQAEYLDIEQKMKDYAKAVGISLDELDLLLWSQKTGYVFK